MDGLVKAFYELPTETTKKKKKRKLHYAWILDSWYQLTKFQVPTGVVTLVWIGKFNGNLMGLSFLSILESLFWIY